MNVGAGAESAARGTSSTVTAVSPRCGNSLAPVSGSLRFATAAAREGAVVAQVPRHTFSLWTMAELLPRLALGAGVIHRSDMFAAIDNAVTLPGYTRLDLAAYYRLTRTLRVQANLENALDADYFAHADNNNNISPGYPRALRAGLSMTF